MKLPIGVSTLEGAMRQNSHSRAFLEPATGIRDLRAAIEL